MVKGVESLVNAEDVMKVSLYPPPSSPWYAAAADSFDSPKAPPVPIKVENEANASFPDRTT